MKWTLLLLILTTWKMGASQTWQEWTRQNKTKIKYLLQQIAANKVYIEYLEKGYRIAQDGLGTIRDAKRGDFKLHLEFFSSRERVSPAIRNMTRIVDMIACESRIGKIVKQALQQVRESGQFSKGELEYCRSVCDRLLIECSGTMAELAALIRDGALSMKDDGRIERINGLYGDMIDNYSFASSFGGEVAILSRQRAAEKVEIFSSRKLNGLQ